MEDKLRRVVLMRLLFSAKLSCCTDVSMPENMPMYYVGTNTPEIREKSEVSEETE